MCFQKKYENHDIEQARFKVRIVAKEFLQVEDINYHEFFSLIVKH